MNKKKKQTMKQHRRRTLTIGVALSLTLLVGTTFAFQQILQTAFNPDLVGVVPGGRIHDIFEGGRNEDSLDMFGPRNKNVFMENFGQIPMGVRVQFHEFVAIAGIPLNVDGEAMDINDTTTWSTVRFNEDLNRQGDVDTEGTSAYIEDFGIEWQLGHFEGEDQAWFMPTFNRIDREVTTLGLINAGESEHYIFNHNNAYLFSDTSGRAIDAIAGAAWEENAGSASDLLDWQDYEDASHHINHFRGQTGRLQHTGAFDFWAPDETGEIQTEEGRLWFLTPSGEITYEDDYEMTASQTLPAADIRVMSLDQWLEAEMPRGNFWVHDETSPEGWFYWVGAGMGELAGMLEPGTATSLLLRETVLPVRQGFEYIVRVNSEIFIANDLPDDIADDNDIIAIFRPRVPEAVVELAPIFAGGSAVLPFGATTVTVGEFSLTLDGEQLPDPEFIATIVAEYETSPDTYLEWVNPLILHIGDDEPNIELTIIVSEERLEQPIEITVTLGKTTESVEEPIEIPYPLPNSCEAAQPLAPGLVCHYDDEDSVVIEPAATFPWDDHETSQRTQSITGEFNYEALIPTTFTVVFEGLHNDEPIDGGTMAVWFNHENLIDYITCTVLGDGRTTIFNVAPNAPVPDGDGIFTYTVAFPPAQFTRNPNVWAHIGEHIPTGLRCGQSPLMP